MDNNPKGDSPYYDRPDHTGQSPVVSPRRQPDIYSANSFSGNARILGILSIIMAFTSTIFPSLILASLAILLAFLSRGKNQKLLKSAKSGVITGTIAIVMNLVLFFGSAIVLFSDPTHQQLNKTCEQIYGMDYDEMINGIKNGTMDYDDLYDSMQP